MRAKKVLSAKKFASIIEQVGAIHPQGRIWKAPPMPLIDYRTYFGEGYPSTPDGVALEFSNLPIDENQKFVGTEWFAKYFLGEEYSELKARRGELNKDQRDALETYERQQTLMFQTEVLFLYTETSRLKPEATQFKALASYLQKMEKKQGDDLTSKEAALQSEMASERINQQQVSYLKQGISRLEEALYLTKALRAGILDGSCPLHSTAEKVDETQAGTWSSIDIRTVHRALRRWNNLRQRNQSASWALDFIDGRSAKAFAWLTIRSQPFGTDRPTLLVATKQPDGKQIAFLLAEDLVDHVYMSYIEHLRSGDHATTLKEAVAKSGNVVATPTDRFPFVCAPPRAATSTPAIEAEEPAADEPDDDESENEPSGEQLTG